MKASANKVFLWTKLSVTGGARAGYLLYAVTETFSDTSDPVVGVRLVRKR